MVVSADNFKIFRCAVWGEGASHGGAISTTEIASSGDQVIFDNITDSQRTSGATEYRKIFFQNGSPNDTASFKCYISRQYTAENQEISIALATGSDIQSTASGYTFTQPTNAENGIDLGSLAAGASRGVWIKRVVTASGDGIEDDTFGLMFETY